jgi:enamine deaminase RidA (YjgF/YER057c/UK114 family)
MQGGRSGRGAQGAPAHHLEHDPVVARKSEHPTHTEWYLTGRPEEGCATEEGAKRVFETLAARIVAEGLAVLQEKIYCLGRARAAVLALRAAALSRMGVQADWPVTVLEGAPASGTELGGVQLWGVAARPQAGQRVETVDLSARGARIRGREWIAPDFRLLVLAAIDGSPGSGTGAGANTAPEQARLMFERASAALAARGFSFPQVARTWIYLARILDWYGEFNQVRNAHFRQVGLAGADQAPFPASTGIEGRHDGAECLMDLLAIDTRSAEPANGLSVRPILRTERQGQAAAYGSAFARAVVLDRGGKKIIHVSGTASIDADGHSTHLDDVSAQYCGTLLSIAALLEQEGASLTDICQGTLFAKTPAVARACRQVSRRLGLAPLPLVEVIADICRPELLVEIEAIAIAP